MIAMAEWESITDPANRVTRLSYDANGNLISIINPDNGIRRFQYDSEHQLVGQVGINGRMSNYMYDDFGRVSGSITSDGATTEVRPVAVSEIKGVMTGQGTIADPLALMHPEDVEGSFTDRNGNQGRLKSNEFGSTTERTDALEQTTQIERDANNNPVRITDAAGRITVNEYDSMGNLISATDRQTGAVTRYTYESQFNQVSSIQNPNGDRTQFTYDNRGNLTRVTDHLGRMASYTYNYRRTSGKQHGFSRQ